MEVGHWIQLVDEDGEWPFVVHQEQVPEEDVVFGRLFLALVPSLAEPDRKVPGVVGREVVGCPMAWTMC